MVVSQTHKQLEFIREQSNYNTETTDSGSSRCLAGHVFEPQFTDLSNGENVKKLEGCYRPVLST